MIYLQSNVEKDQVTHDSSSISDQLITDQHSSGDSLLETARQAPTFYFKKNLKMWQKKTYVIVWY